MKNKLQLTVVLMACLYLFNSCSDPENSLRVKLNKSINSTNEIGQPIQFKIVKYNPKTNHAELRIQCDFDQIDSETYLNELSKVENLLNREGVRNLSYQIVNRPGSDLPNYYNKISYPSYQQKKPLFKNNSPFENWTRKLNDSEFFSKAKQIPILKPKNILKRKRGKVNYNYVRLREKPTLASPIITYLFEGTVVKAKEKSKNQQTIAGDTDYWYLLETRDNKKGWLFGTYLSETKERNISSSLQNNLIYRDFLQKKRVLIPKEYRKSLTLSSKNVKIMSHNLALKINPNKILYLPFNVINEKVRWKLNKINLKNTQPILKEKYRREYPKNYISEEDSRNYYRPGPEDFNLISDSKYNDYSDYNRRNYNRPKPSLEDIEPDYLNNYVVPFHDKKEKLSVKKTFSQPKREIIRSAKNYNLRFNISPYTKNQLGNRDLVRANAVLKIIEARLISHDYNKSIRFHQIFNAFYDTVEIALLNIDFKEKKATFSVQRIEPDHVRNGHREIARDIWEIDFTKLGNIKLNYDKLGDLYYSEILLSLSRSGTDYKNDIIGLANYAVDLLVKQKYI